MKGTKIYIMSHSTTYRRFAVRQVTTDISDIVTTLYRQSGTQQAHQKATV